MTPPTDPTQSGSSLQGHEAIEGEPTGGSMIGTKPITDRDSKMVMLRAERGDIIQIERKIAIFQDQVTIPDRVVVKRRTSTYYGTELLAEVQDESNRDKYLLTAPGPDTYLYLWISETDVDGFREGWKVGAELQASFSDDLPQYSICPKCEEPIKSLEHVRMAAIDECPIQSS